jgi:hypothetical protein
MRISGTHFKINRPFIDIFARRIMRSERNDQTVWDSLFDMAVSIADQFEILPIIPMSINGRLILKCVPLIQAR